MAASMTFDRINIRKRAMMLTYIFSNQEWSSYAGSLVTIIMLLCYKGRWEVRHTPKVDGVWYIIVGVSLVPAFAMLYQCLTLPELIKYIKDQQRKTADHESDVSMSKDEIAKLKAAQHAVRFGSCSILRESSLPGSFFCIS
ncbi:hypothetical protein BDN70DRAFT_493151 [Pholiota conissans]|uniref:Uncharacterized protein n=1 Tax=Pholiota conissans TaxID=109636 RepID=A0A9P5YNL0_9AGAR|nr:hypothetical protein BDN70DRAFT_493151 [Pholiota conissans]